MTSNETITRMISIYDDANDGTFAGEIAESCAAAIIHYVRSQELTDDQFDYIIGGQRNAAAKMNGLGLRAMDTINLLVAARNN